MLKGRYDEGPHRDQQPPQVLVVDDEPANVRLVQAYLKAEGFRVLGAFSGAEALELVEKGGVDLILLDIRMPHMDGFEVCRRIRENPACARMPVVFLTAEFNDADSELQGLEAGADEYLHKPIQRRALVARVRNLIRLADAERDRRMATQLAQSEKLAAIGQIAAGVAHEINNPLTWVKSNLAYCLERLAGPAGGAGAAPPGELRESLAEALQGADRIEAIVKAMRSLGRPERPDAVEEVDVRDELLNALQMARNHLTQRAALSIAVPPALPRVKAKTNELGRVFLNLLMNAAQAIPEGASAQNRVAVAARAEDGEVVVEVADTGCGLSDEVRARMFEPFFTTKPVGQGTGLGLTIARAIVDAAGGRLEAEREEGRGARFRVCLPAVGGEGAPEARRPATAAGARSRSRVLVIDDEPMVRRSFERMLERHHEVVGLDSAAEALARLEAGERWDAILCDLMMSGTDGIAFHEALSVRFPALLPRLAFVTGGAFGERATRFLAEHEVPVVPKPVEVAALLEAVERLAGGGRG